MQLVPFRGCKVLKMRGMGQLDSYNVRQGTLDHLKDRGKEPLERLAKQSEGQKRWLRLNPSIQWEKGDLSGALMTG